MSTGLAAPGCSLRVNERFAAMERFLVRDYGGCQSAWHAVEKLAYGAFSGAISRTATAPVDRIRIVMQAEGVATANLGSMQVFRQILTNEGVAAFWRGNCANVIKIVPDSALMYGMNAQLKTRLIADADSPTAAELLLAGGLAGTLTSLVVYPLDSARVVLATAPRGTFRGLSDVLRGQFRQGPGRLYFGASTSVLGNFPFTALQLGAADVIKHLIQRDSEASAVTHNVQYDTWRTTAELLLSGTLASAAALTLTYPIWLFRVKLQTSGIPGHTAYNGLADVAQQTWRQGGLRALYRGLAPSMAKVLPANAISYAVFNLLTEAPTR